MTLDIEAAMAPLPMRLRPATMRWLESTASTNDAVISLAREGTPGPWLVGADHQTAGRGRRGNTWTDPGTDALLFSIGLIADLPGETLPLLSPASAVAIAESIEEHTGTRAAVKWPNDVMMNDRKVCGVLLESQALDEATLVVIGVGVNVLIDQEFFDRHELPAATSIKIASGRSFEREPLLASIVGSVLSKNSGLGAMDRRRELQRRFEARSWLIGRSITVEAAGERVQGEVRGIDLQGALVIERADGTRASVSTAHAHVIP